VHEFLRFVFIGEEMLEPFPFRWNGKGSFYQDAFFFTRTGTTSLENAMLAVLHASCAGAGQPVKSQRYR
jgi:hypothetical protein